MDYLICIVNILYAYRSDYVHAKHGRIMPMQRHVTSYWFTILEQLNINVKNENTDTVNAL